jgi:hypothetical protein
VQIQVAIIVWIKELLKDVVQKDVVQKEAGFRLRSRDF